MVLTYADLLFVLELFYGSVEAESACSERGGERQQGVQALDDGCRRSVVPTTVVATAKSPAPNLLVRFRGRHGCTELVV